MAEGVTTVQIVHMYHACGDVIKSHFHSPLYIYTSL